MSASAINMEELNRRRKMLEDAYKFSPYIPDDLRQQLEEKLDLEQRELVIQLQILAIQFGRKLEARDRTNQVELPPMVIVSSREPQPSQLIQGPMQNADIAGQTQEILKPGETAKPAQPREIMVAPEHALKHLHGDD